MLLSFEARFGILALSTPLRSPWHLTLPRQVGMRRYFELLDVRGKIAIENGEKVVHASCKLGRQRLSVVETSPW